MTIRIALADLLKEKGITQSELARKTGIRPSTINHIYWELSKYINLEHLEKICNELNCHISDILIKEK